jgi:hypothetical protein
LRAGSDDAAGFMDRISPRITIWNAHTDDRSSEARARLAWRNREVLPNIDVTARTTQSYGAFVLRGEVGARLSLDHQTLTGTATAGASWAEGQRWVDASATYQEDDTRRYNLAAGWTSEDQRTFLSTNVGGVFGRDLTASGASGRVAWEVDLDHRLWLRDANGSIGAYAGVIMDSNGSNRDFRAGLVFRLTW